MSPMKTLLISENKSDWDIIRNILKVHYSHVELVCAISAQDAMNAASSDGPFGFFLLDCNLRQSDPNELGQSLLDLTGERPILFFGHEHVIRDRIKQELFEANEFNDTIYKPLDRPDILEELQAKIDRALSWAEDEEYEQSIEEINPEEFIPMKIRAFYLYSKFPYDIYLAITKNNFIKIISADKSYSHSTLSAYARKNIKFLYIRKDDQLKYLDGEAGKCLKALTKMEAKNPDIYLLQLRSITIFHQYIQALGVTPSVISLGDAIVDSVYLVTKEKIKLSTILSEYPQFYEGISSKSLLTAYIAEGLAKKLGWDSETTKKKLTMASILQDITLPEEAMTKINSLEQYQQQGFKEEDLETYINHPASAANYAKQFTAFTDLDYIVENHHELPGRKGFPNRPSSSKFTQITAVFNSAQYVASEIDGLTLDNTLFSLVLKSITKDYTSAIFKETQRHLKTILRFK